MPIPAAPAVPAAVEILGRSSSHYTRMVRLLAHALGVDYTLRPIHDLMSEDPATFAGNPALKLPALRIGGAVGSPVYWGSTNACRQLARLVPGGEARVFWPEQANALANAQTNALTDSALLANAHEVLAHAMAAQVEVVFHEVVSQRAPDAASRKRRRSLELCLAWLDAELDAVHAALPAGKIALFDLGLFCLLDHLTFRNPMDLSGLPRLSAFASEFGARPEARATPYSFDPRPEDSAAG